VSEGEGVMELQEGRSGAGMANDSNGKSGPCCEKKHKNISIAHHRT
jgi:hypothetical protein